jgi:[acyl-carrier-protein] S-malonyltransferase
MTATVLAMFPGQGSQFVGMGRELLSEFPATKRVFEEAEDAARINVRKLCLDGPEDELKLTANTQPCILTVSVATWRVLESEAGIRPAAFAGHSLGEYSAVVAAGKIPLAAAAALVRKRGEAMQAAVPAGVGAMAAVMNVAADDLGARAAKLSKPGHVVEVVNFNSPQQLVVAGHKRAVDALCSGLEADGLRFVVLPVSAPFHSSLMQPAKDVMAPLLDATPFAKTDAKVIANLTGKVEADYGARFLIEQIAAPVLWTQSLETASQSGVDAYVEIGPGKVLFGLARRSVPKGAKLLHTEEVKKVLPEIQALA